MATWSDVVQYIKSHYRISEEQPDMIKMVFDTGDLRSQVVFIWRQTLAGGEEEWVQIESPFGELGSVDLGRALAEVGSTVCGGMAQFANVVTIRHALPLENLNLNEFERPLALVTNTADAIERKLVGGDRY
jgi:hypothetical protein